MDIKTKFNIGDFVKTIRGEEVFGKISDIRAHVHDRKIESLTINNQYRVLGNWHYESDIKLSSFKEYQDYCGGRTTTTTDNIY